MGWFTITLIIEFCKLNYQSATTLGRNSKSNMGILQLSINVSLNSLIQKWNKQQEKRVHEKWGREGVFTLTLIIEFCKLNHQSTTTEADFTEKHGGTLLRNTAFHECFPNP
jgi:hypothetical protein